MGNVKRLMAGIFVAAAVVVATAPAASASSPVEYVILLDGGTNATAIEYGLLGSVYEDARRGSSETRPVM
ncbi:hypothetical protein [Amycolatopsis rifamycinica]|uniref:Uncharacterized protein n=1 Tax=Amycolatopsis rifamycinica TaxID=287986 RepID=A0A066TTW7_9PSEU|nr:hypothetical protein [Amycolatopsis rifamycinica]KDN18295.1 hypothetical protein DV20_31135 [Amycolatopsis rifamycinica]